MFTAGAPNPPITITSTAFILLDSSDPSHMSKKAHTAAVWKQPKPRRGHTAVPPPYGSRAILATSHSDRAVVVRCQLVDRPARSSYGEGAISINSM